MEQKKKLSQKNISKSVIRRAKAWWHQIRDNLFKFE